MKSSLHVRGFTLVELMVAIAIGLFLTTVIAHLFINSRTAYNTTDEVSRMQENMRFAYQVLVRTVHLTAYRSSPNTFATGEWGLFTGPAIALEGTNDDVNGSDTLTVRYQGSGALGAPDGTIVDCSGAEITSNEIVTNLFYIRAGQNGGLALWCDRSVVGVGAVTQFEVVPDVQAMHILYGEDTDSPRDTVADRYVPRAGVANMDSVVSVRIALLFQTTNAGNRDDPDTRAYDLNGVAVGPFNDTRVRRLVTWNLNLRNRTP
jgi:type IV pilus assembly protein PilW